MPYALTGSILLAAAFFVYFPLIAQKDVLLSSTNRISITLPTDFHEVSLELDSPAFLETANFTLEDDREDAADLRRAVGSRRVHQSVSRYSTSSPIENTNTLRSRYRSIVWRMTFSPGTQVELLAIVLDGRTIDAKHLVPNHISPESVTVKLTNRVRVSVSNFLLRANEQISNFLMAIMGIVPLAVDLL